MAVHQFGEWLPDRADYRSPGAVRAEDCLPAPTGYRPIRSLEPVTDALDARPRGAIQARNQDGVVFQYAGDASKLYQNVDDSWTDRSKSGGYSMGTDERWEFVAWKNKVLATNFGNNPQQITFGGTEFSDLTSDFQARHITVIRDFVVFANTSDSADGNVPSRVRWSAFNDETDYTVSASTLSDFQDLKTAGIERIFGGEYGVIFQPAAVWRMTFAGSPTVFEFDEVLPGIGLIAAGAAAQIGDIIYFLSEQGFFSLADGTRATPIGVGKVDRFVLNDIDKDNLHRVSAVADNSSQLVMWAYPGVGNTDGRPNRIIVYDRGLDSWSLLTDEVELLWRTAGAGESLDSLSGESLDDLDVSLDSGRWVGGASEMGAFDSEFKSGFFDGEVKAATIETREFEFTDGARSRLKGFRALVQGDTSTSVTAQVGTRNSLNDTVSFSSELAPNDEGHVKARDMARYHRFRLEISGSWSHAVGVQVSKRDVRAGGRRG